MKKVFFFLAIAVAIVMNVNAQNYRPTSTYPSSYGTTNSSIRYHNGYYKSNGTYVNGHYKTTSNTTNHDNFSTVGNKNPFTGSTGITPRDYSPRATNYGSGRTIYTGPRGGQYYINSNGNKTYVPKR